MKYILNLVIVALIVFLAFALYDGIKEPIIFRTEKDIRQDAVTQKLESIRDMQEMHREIRGDFAASFAELVQVLSTDSIPFNKLIADPDDPENPDKFIVETTYTNAADTIARMGIDLTELKYVPYTNKSVSFEMMADTMTYQKTLVPVMECTTKWNKFMGEYADTKYKKYDDTYDPNNTIGFGSMSSPNLEGNWN